MSRGIIFHSAAGDAIPVFDVAYAESLAVDVTCAVLDVKPKETGHWLLDFCYPSVPKTFSLHTWISQAQDDRFFAVRLEHHDIFEVCLNTLIEMGSPPVQLIARLAGSAADHCWIAGPNRAWLAGVIEHGRKWDLLRSGMNWEEVASLLRQRADEPIVTSGMVMETFPNPRLAGRASTQKDWYDLPYDQRWKLAFEGLRWLPDLEITSERLGSQGFGTGMTAFRLNALRAEIMEERETAYRSSNGSV